MGPGESPSETTSEEQEAIAAFFKGIGLQSAGLEAGRLPELMETAGGLLRTMTLGLIKVVGTRDIAKNEWHLAETLLAPTGNNPFKVFEQPDAPLEQKLDEALARLLCQRDPAFQKPIDAAVDSFDLVSAHEAATLAIMLDALREILSRLSPVAIDGRLEGGPLLRTLIPSAKKARCWDLFIQEHTELERDGKNNFKLLLREVAGDTYKDAVQRLMRSRDP